LAVKIIALVKPGARHESVEKLASGEYRVAVNAPPQDGKANAAVIAALAAHFGVTKAQVQITAGHKGKRKIIEILER
jgi:uncharacterized protein (TIGR00251 family)